MKKMKKIWIIFLCITLIYIFPTTAEASDSYMFSLTSGGSENVKIKVGETFPVKIELSKGDAGENFTMYAASYTFKYSKSYFDMDTSDMEFNKNNNGMIYTRKEDPKWKDWENITISVISSDVEGMNWSNPSELLSFNMIAKKTGVSTVICTSAAMSDKAGNALESEHNNLQITVTGESGTSNNSGGGQSGGGTAQNGNNAGNQSGGNGNGQGGNGAGQNVGGNVGSQSGGNSTNQNTAQPEVDKNVSNVENPDNINNPVKTDTPKKIIFSDVRSSDWYADAAAYVSGKGYFNGLPGNIFAPDINMTRAMFVTVIGRIEGINAGEFSGSNFTDVVEGSWYAPYVKWAAQNGIVTGAGSGKFDPDGNVTREQTATIIYRYVAYKGYSTEVKNTEAFERFEDGKKVSDYAREAMLWACSEGVIKGTGQKLEASKKATRAQVAQIIKNFTERVR